MIQLLVSITFGLLLVACGSDNDSDSPTQDAPIYIGSEEMAVIDTTDKAESIVREMFGLGGVVVSPTADETEEPKPEPYNILVPLAVTKTIEQINEENVVDSATAKKNLNIVSYCEEDQGVFDYNITIDDLTGVFNGTINYRDCLVADFSLQGSATVTGNFDLVINTIHDINMDFLWLRVDSETISYEAAGVISVEFAELTSPSTTTTITTTTLQEHAVTINGSPVVKFDDYAIAVTDDGLTKTLILTGTFYHPTHGYVSVSTDGLLEFTDDNVWPYYGYVNMEGDKVDQDGGNTLLRILCEDYPKYTLWVDTDGDGYWDDDPKLIDWL